MKTAYIVPGNSFSTLFAEDASAPSLRDPRIYSIRRSGRLARMVKRLIKRSEG